MVQGLHSFLHISLINNHQLLNAYYYLLIPETGAGTIKVKKVHSLTLRKTQVGKR